MSDDGVEGVEWLHHGGTSALCVSTRRSGGLIEGVPDNDNLNGIAAVVSDTVALLLRRGIGHIDAPLNTQLAAGICHALSVVSCRCRNDACCSLFVGNLNHGVVGTANLVRAHVLEVFPLEEYLCTGDFGKTWAELQRSGRNNRRNSCLRNLNIGRVNKSAFGLGSRHRILTHEL